MTQPDRIPINPESTEGLERWLLIHPFFGDNTRLDMSLVVRPRPGESPWIAGNLVLSRRDACVLADWCAVELWKDKVAMDDELEGKNQVEADGLPPPLKETDFAPGGVERLKSEMSDMIGEGGTTSIQNAPPDPGASVPDDEYVPPKKKRYKG